MHKWWIALAAALALSAGATHAATEATAGAKAAATSPQATPAKAPAGKPSAAPKKLVNLNTATREELKALPGGSEAEADRIIAGRPYNSKALLVTNNVISDGRYGMIRKLVVAGEPAKPAKK